MKKKCIYKKIHHFNFDHDLGVKVTGNVAQYPLHHVTFSATKFEVVTSKEEDMHLQEISIFDL